MQESSFEAWQLQLEAAGWQARVAQSRACVVFVTLPEGVTSQLARQLVAAWLARIYLGTSHARVAENAALAWARNYLLGSTALLTQLVELVHAHHLHLHLEQTQLEAREQAQLCSPELARERVVNHAEFCYQLRDWELVDLDRASPWNWERSSPLLAWWEQARWNWQQLELRQAPCLAGAEPDFLTTTPDQARAVYWLPELSGKLVDGNPSDGKSETETWELEFCNAYLEYQEQQVLQGGQVLPLIIFTSADQLAAQWLPWCRQHHLEVAHEQGVTPHPATRLLRVAIWYDVPWWSLLCEPEVSSQCLGQLLGLPSVAQEQEEGFCAATAGSGTEAPYILQSRVTNHELRYSLTSVNLSLAWDERYREAGRHTLAPLARADDCCEQGDWDEPTLNEGGLEASLDPRIITNTQRYLQWYAHRRQQLANQARREAVARQEAQERRTNEFEQERGVTPRDDRASASKERSLNQLAHEHDVTLAQAGLCLNLEQVWGDATTGEQLSTSSPAERSSLASWQETTTKQLSYPSSRVRLLLPWGARHDRLVLDLKLGTWRNRVATLLAQQQMRSLARGSNYATQLRSQVEHSSLSLPRLALDRAIAGLLELGRVARQLEGWGASNSFAPAQNQPHAKPTPLEQQLAAFAPVLRERLRQAARQLVPQLHGYCLEQSCALLANRLVELQATMHAPSRLARQQRQVLQAKHQQVTLVRALLRRAVRERAWDVVVVPQLEAPYLTLLAQLGVAALTSSWELELGVRSAQQVWALKPSEWHSAEPIYLTPVGCFWGYSLSDLVDILLYKILHQYQLEVVPWFVLQFQRKLVTVAQRSSNYRWHRVTTSQLSQLRRTYRLRFLPSGLILWQQRFSRGARRGADVGAGESQFAHYKSLAQGRYQLPRALLTQVHALRYELQENQVLDYPERLAHASLTAAQLFTLVDAEVTYYLALTQLLNPAEHRISRAQLRKHFCRVVTLLFEHLEQQLQSQSDNLAGRGLSMLDVLALEDLGASEHQNLELTQAVKACSAQAQHELLLLAQIFALPSASSGQTAQFSPREVMERESYLANLELIASSIWHAYLEHARAWHTTCTVELAPRRSEYHLIAVRRTGLEAQLGLGSRVEAPAQLYYQLLRRAQARPPCSRREPSVASWVVPSAVLQELSAPTNTADREQATAHSRPWLCTPAQLEAWLVSSAAQQDSAPLNILYVTSPAAGDEQVLRLSEAGHQLTELVLETDWASASLESCSPGANEQFVSLRAPELESLRNLLSGQTAQDAPARLAQLTPSHYLAWQTSATYRSYQYLRNFIRHDLAQIEQLASLTPYAQDVACEDLRPWQRWQSWLQSQDLLAVQSQAPCWSAMLNAWQVLGRHQAELHDLGSELGKVGSELGLMLSPQPSSIVTDELQFESLQNRVGDYNQLTLRAALLRQEVLGWKSYHSPASLRMDAQLRVQPSEVVTLGLGIEQRGRGKGVAQESLWCLLKPDKLDLSGWGIPLHAWQYAEIYSAPSTLHPWQATPIPTWWQLLGRIMQQLTESRLPPAPPQAVRYAELQRTAQAQLGARVARQLNLGAAQLGWTDQGQAEATASEVSSLEVESQQRRWSTAWHELVSEQRQQLVDWLHQALTHEPTVASREVVMEGWRQLMAHPHYQQLTSLLEQQGIAIPSDDADALAWWLSMWFWGGSFPYVQRCLRVQNLAAEAQLLETQARQLLEEITETLAQLAQTGVRVELQHGEDDSPTRISADEIPLLTQLLAASRVQQQVEQLEARQQSQLLVRTAFAANLAAQAGASSAQLQRRAGGELGALVLESSMSYSLVQGRATCLRDTQQGITLATRSEQGLGTSTASLAIPPDLAWVLSEAQTGLPLVVLLKSSSELSTPLPSEAYRRLVLEHHCWRRTRHLARCADLGRSRLARLPQAQQLAIGQPLPLHQQQLHTAMQASVNYRPRTLGARTWQARHLHDYLLHPTGSSTGVSSKRNDLTQTHNHLLSIWQLQAQAQLQMGGIALSLGLASNESTGWGCVRHYAVQTPANEIVSRPASHSSSSSSSRLAQSSQLRITQENYQLLNSELATAFHWADLRFQSWQWSTWYEEQRVAWLGQELAPLAPAPAPQAALRSTSQDGAVPETTLRNQQLLRWKYQLSRATAPTQGWGGASEQEDENNATLSYLCELTPERLQREWLGVASAHSLSAVVQNLEYGNQLPGVHKQLRSQAASLGLELGRKTALLQTATEYQLLPPELVHHLGQQLLLLYGSVDARRSRMHPAEREPDSCSAIVAPPADQEVISRQGQRAEVVTFPSREQEVPEETARPWWRRLLTLKRSTTPKKVTAPPQPSNKAVSEPVSQPAWQDMLQAHDYGHLTEMLHGTRLVNHGGSLSWKTDGAEARTRDPLRSQASARYLPPRFYISIVGTVAGAWEQRKQELSRYSELDTDVLARDYLIQQWCSDLPQQASYLIPNLRLSRYDCKQLAFSYFYAQACYTMVLGYDNKHQMRALQDAYIDPREVFRCFWGNGTSVSTLPWDWRAHSPRGATGSQATILGASAMRQLRGVHPAQLREVATHAQRLVSRVMYMNASVTLLQMNFARYKLGALDLHLSRQQAQLEVNQVLVLARLHYLYWNSLLANLKNLQACMDGTLGWQYLGELPSCRLEQLYRSTYNFYTLDPFTQTQLAKLTAHYRSTVTTYTYKAMQIYLYQSL